MRTNVGNGDGVTIASIRPETRSTATNPTATETTTRPCSASTCARGRLPGEITDQPSRMPAAAARNTAVNSSRPCGVSRPRKRSALPALNISPADHTDVRGVFEQHKRNRQSQHNRVRDVLGRHPGVVHPDLQRKRGRRMFAVVRSEVVLDELVELV